MASITGSWDGSGVSGTGLWATEGIGDELTTVAIEDLVQVGLGFRDVLPMLAETGTP